MENIKAEKLVETIYQNLIENIPDDVCNSCPVIAAMRTVVSTMKRHNNEEIANQLGIDTLDFSCPFSEKKTKVRKIKE